MWLGGAIIKYSNLIWILALPGLAFFLLGAAVLLGVNQIVDLAGMNAVLGAAFLAIGCGICLFRLALVVFELVPSAYGRWFWFLSAALFMLIFYDAAFGIHERMPQIGLPETAFFFFEALLLAGLILPVVKTLSVKSLLALAAFGGLSALAVLGDAGPEGEGIITIMGRRMSFEQSSETLALFALMSAYFFMALDDIRKRLHH